MSAECDFAVIHNLLAKAPSNLGCPIENVIAAADSLFERVPPEKLKKLCDNDIKKLIYYNQ
jgi:hypothetical protein